MKFLISLGVFISLASSVFSNKLNSLMTFSSEKFTIQNGRNTYMENIISGRKTGVKTTMVKLN